MCRLNSGCLWLSLGLWEGQTMSTQLAPTRGQPGSQWEIMDKGSRLRDLTCGLQRETTFSLRPWWSKGVKTLTEPLRRGGRGRSLIVSSLWGQTDRGRRREVAEGIEINPILLDQEDSKPNYCMYGQFQCFRDTVYLKAFICKLTFKLAIHEHCRWHWGKQK